MTIDGASQSLQVTLDTCASEPIRIPGAIQPHGALLACRGDDLRVVQASADAAAWFGREGDVLLGRSLLELFDAASGERLVEARRAERVRELGSLRLVARGGRAVEVLPHRVAPDLLIVELEEAAADDAGRVGFDERLRAIIIRLQASRDIAGLYRELAAQFRGLTGFDRVMVYRFDAEWNGEVVAECKRDDLEPFLGLHYPAADIPAQARQLYTANWLRLIVDVAYRPRPIVPTLDPETGAPLDLSHAVLRSVSPIHIEYLRNMGVTASMSISLVHDGTLIGLIACHHYSGPRWIPHRTRDTAEFLGQAVSWQLRVLETAAAAERSRSAAACEAEVLRAAVNDADLLAGLATPTLLRLTASTGAAVVLQDGVRRIGECPGNAALVALVDALARCEVDVFATDCLAEAIPAASDERFAGLLAVALSNPLKEYILWFRPPTERTVDWAGDPRKSVTVDASGGQPRLSPRGSFALWRETVRGRSSPWQAWEVAAASNLRKSLLGGVRQRAAHLDELNRRLLDADRAKDDFIATVSHELRTPLSAILGWSHLLQQTGTMCDKTRHGLTVVERNAKAQAQLIDDLLDVSRMVSGKLSLDIESVDMVGLVESVLDGFEVAASAKQLRVRRILDPSSTPVLGDPTRLHQVVANLVSNAIKFTPRHGSITVALRRVESDIELIVEDTGEGIGEELLPLVFDLFRQGDAGMNRRSRGLGIGLAIARKLVELHGGRITAASPGVGRGATFCVRVPLSPLRAEVPRTTPIPTPPSGKLDGLRILVVEDEPDARELVSFILQSSGASVEAAGDAAGALAMLSDREYDVLVSDVGMPGQDGLEMIRAVRARGRDAGGAIPAVALTAYSRAYDRTTALQAGFDAHVPKPVDAAELVVVVASAAGRRGR